MNKMIFALAVGAILVAVSLGLSTARPAPVEFTWLKDASMLGRLPVVF
jgi:hypothetical protein